MSWLKSTNVIAGIGVIAMGAFLLDREAPAGLGWVPWACIGGGALLVLSAGLGALLERR